VDAIKAFSLTDSYYRAVVRRNSCVSVRDSQREKGKERGFEKIRASGSKTRFTNTLKTALSHKSTKRKIKAKKGEENDDRTMVLLETPKALT